MMKKLLLLLTFYFSIFLFHEAKAQTLQPGDIAFIGMNQGATSTFSFIALKTLPANEILYFTDQGWNITTWASASEGHLVWTIPANVTCGTIVTISYNGTFSIAGTANVPTLSPAGGAFGFSTSGDQILAYQSTSGAKPANPIFIAGLHMNYSNSNNDGNGWQSVGTSGDASVSTIPTGLINGQTCVALYDGTTGEPDNAKYNYSTTANALSGLSSDLKILINDRTRWNLNASAYDLSPNQYGTINVTCTVATSPSVTTNTPVSNFGAVTAVLGGIATDGGATISERGVVWALSTDPIIGSGGVTKVTNGSGTGSFSATISSLPPGTTIYYRAFATNSVGTSYGNTVSFTTNAALSATQSQTDPTCNNGSNGTATVTPSGGKTAYTYLWTPSGSTNATLTGLAAGSYIVLISDAEGTSMTKNFTINNPPATPVTITTNPASVSICTGSGITLTSAATNATTYKWYVSTNGGTSYTLLTNTAPYSNTTTASLSIAGITAGMNGFMYRVEANNTCSTATSSAATLTVTSNVAITANPANKSVCSGSNTNFSVTAAGASSYQWMVSTDTGGTYTNLTNSAPYSNVNTATLNITGATGTLNGTMYKCMVGNGCGTSGTIGATLTVSAITISQSSTNVTTYGGNNGTATATPSGGIFPYYYSWSPSGGTAATATGLYPGTYTVDVTDGNSCMVTSAAYIITQPAGIYASVSTLPNFSTCSGTASSTQSFYVNAGGLTANLVVTAPTGFEVSTAPNSGFGSSVSITPSAGNVNNTNIYVRIAASASGSLNGNVTVSSTGVTTKNVAVTGTLSTMAITSQPSNTSGCPGSNKTFTATASNATSYLWYESTNNGASFTALTNTAPYSGVTTATLTLTGITATMNGREYRVIATGSCGNVSSDVATLSVSNISASTTITGINCYGSATGTASVTPTGGAIPYYYLWSANAGSATTQSVSNLAAGTYSVTITDANSCSVTISNIVVSQIPEMLVNLTKVNVACNGGSTGSASVAPTGGTSGYSYLWSTGATTSSIIGLPAGNYSVTVKDANQCEKTESFTITQLPALTATQGTVNNPNCFGGGNGSASVIVTGGQTPYTYDWNGTPTGDGTATISGLSQGTYTVTVKDANQCETSLSITVNQPSALNISLSKTDVSCNGGGDGKATATVTGGTGSYTYTWTPVGGNAATATGLLPGTYTITVRDANNCQASQSIIVGQPVLLTATASKTDVLCNGGSTGTATALPSGGNGGYNYVWRNSSNTVVGTAATATGLPVGNYSCTITDSVGCFTTLQNITINQPSLLVASTVQTNATCASGGQATVIPNGGMGGYQYLWSPTGATTSSITGLAAGNYSCIITDANGCSITKSFVISTTNTLVAATFKTDLLCNGVSTGSAGVIPSGAPGPFTYVWSPSGGNADTATGLAAGNYSVLITASNGCSITKNFTITQPSALTVTPTQTNLICNGAANGSASVAVTGGTGAYTYSWAPAGGSGSTANNLAAGTYTVTIKDANLCQVTQSFTITQPAAIASIITSQTNASCNGANNGSATITASGGTGAYSYVWAPSGGTAATANGLTAGTYTVTIKDANLCQTTQTVIITEPTVLTATISKTDILCYDAANGTATVVATGGTAAYSYSWAPSGGTAATATNLSPGTYTCTITDNNGCFTTATTTITQPSTAIAATAGAQTNILCHGAATGSATVNVTGGTGAYSYVWAPSGGTAATATGLSAGTYTVTIKDANLCTTTQSFTITEPALLSASAGAQTNVLCHGGATGSATVSVTGGTGAYTYAWAPSGGTAATATGLSAGTYTVTVKDANLCETTQSFTITEPATSLTLTAGAQTNIFCSGAASGSATVIATGGTGVYTYSWAPSGGTAATATGLAGGTYTVTVTDANGCTATQSFTITQTPALTLNGTSTNISCFGQANGAASAGVVGGTAPYVYAWSNGATTNMISGLSAGVYTCTVTDANGCTATSSFTIYEQPQITATSVSTNVTCFGLANGSATVTATGGVPGYSYAWSNGAGGPSVTGLAAGTYTVNISDTNGCAITHTVIITQPEEFELDATVTNINCFGNSDGAIEVTAYGGTEPYTYVWSPNLGTTNSVDGLGTGEYNLTVTDANGCTVEQSFTITQPEPLSVSISQTNVSCYLAGDGELGVAVTGGTGPYTYAWTPNVSTEATATGLAAGNYSVTITDANGCSALRNFSLTQPLELTAAVTSTSPQCVGETGGTATVTATGGTSPYTYEWSTGGTTPTVENLAAGTYTVTVTDAHGCENTVTLNITAPLAVNISLQPQDITITEGSNAIFTVVAANTASYQWQVTTDGTTWTDVNNGGTNPTYAGATLASLIVTDVPQSYDGYAYRAVMTNNTGCTTTSDPALLNVSELVGTVDFKDIRLTVYPNPASTEVFIKLPDFSSHSNIKAELYDLNGRIVRKNNVTTETFSIDVSGLESAVYILNITSDTGTATKRIVVDKK